MIDKATAPQPPDLPRYISVDGVDYAVERVIMSGEDGEYCAATQRIKVQHGVPVEYERTILLHELVHACFEHGGSPGTITEEHAACLISRRLLPILRDNPHLVAYLAAVDDGRES